MTRTLVAASFLVVLAACSAESPTAPLPGALPGVYSLRTVNGSVLPYKIPQGFADLTYTSDVLTVEESGSWTELVGYTYDDLGTIRSTLEQDLGRWTQVADTLRFTSAITHQQIYKGRYGRDTLSLTYANLSLTFVRKGR
jgi:hypothetical protein